MAYTMTAKQFFESVVPGALTAGGAVRKVGGVVQFDIEGTDGGTWFVDLDKGKVAPNGSQPDVMVRATSRDFMALVEGRMSAGDGIMTERLHVAGEATRLSRLMAALESFRMQ